MYVIFALVFVTAFVFFAALRMGGDYYRAPMSERPQHKLHEAFRPSGPVGQGFGVVGGLFCLLTLLYPLRKRWRRLENYGTPRTWFLFHVYFGIAGPLLATLHTTFKFGGLASICYWSMILVMVSGFIGRFLFAQLPRNQRGLVLSLREINEEIRTIQHALQAAGLRDEMNLLAYANRRNLKHTKSDKIGWGQLFRLWTARRRNLRWWNQQIQKRGLPPASAQHILPLVSRKLLLESSLVTLDLTTRAFSHWHTLHLPFTFLMFATLVIHVGLAVFLGYTWIF
jgi:hypothetical protein